jgi:lauroyl/myristoyl acyltransferase
VTVKLFGHRFPASIAAAELARASGCALLPVALPREKSGYSIKLYPEIPYERAALGNREARANLTQEIMRQFEPIIREYLTQWFHFVPLWQPTKI